MNRKFISGVLGLILLQLLLGVVWFSYPLEAQAKSNSSQLVLKLNNSEAISRIMATYNLTGLSQIADNYTRVEVPAGVDPDNLATKMKADPDIMMVTPNKTVSFMEAGNRFHFDFSELGGTANPASLKTQWAWNNIHLANAQKASTGKGVKVAVLDTGVNYNHAMLAGKTLRGFDAINQLNDGNDVNGHGTFVAGVIAQVAPDAQIIPVRVLDANGIGTLDSVLTGFRYALKSGAKVINLSFSTTEDLMPLHDIIIEANSLGVVVVGASGNDASGLPYYPAAYNEVLAVSATDQNDNRASFANYGDYVELSSPGVNIYSSWIDGGYAQGSGTSFSAPMVVGASALLLQKVPGLSRGPIENSLKKASASFANGCACKGMGKGRLDFTGLK
jgi:subtilisin family serine protease